MSIILDKMKATLKMSNVYKNVQSAYKQLPTYSEQVNLVSLPKIFFYLPTILQSYTPFSLISLVSTYNFIHGKIVEF